MSCGAAELQHAGPAARRPLPRRRRRAVRRQARRPRPRVRRRDRRARARRARRSAPAPARRRPRARGLAARALDRLEHELRRRSGRDRLEAVTAAFADAFDAGGVGDLLRPAGSEIVRTVFEGGRRAHRVSGVPSLRFSGTGDEYMLADYPATAAMMARGGSFSQWVADPAADPRRDRAARARRATTASSAPRSCTPAPRGWSSCTATRARARSRTRSPSCGCSWPKPCAAAREKRCVG